LLVQLAFVISSISNNPKIHARRYYKLFLVRFKTKIHKQQFRALDVLRKVGQEDLDFKDIVDYFLLYDKLRLQEKMDSYGQMQ